MTDLVSVRFDDNSDHWGSWGPECAIDARVPSELDDALAEHVWNHLILGFSCSLADLPCEFFDFVVRDSSHPGMVKPSS